MNYIYVGAFVSFFVNYEVLVYVYVMCIYVCICKIVFRGDLGLVLC